jgi:hypothetical protein
VRLLIIIFATISVFSVTAEQLDGLWAQPTFAVSEPTKSVVIVEKVFHYQLAIPKKGHDKVRLVQKKYASVDTAIDAFVSRFSAINTLDYDWWLTTWAQSSKELALDYYKSKGLDKNYWLNAWKKQFIGRKITFKQKVIYQDYVIFIYNVAAPNGQPGVYDLPIVFRQQNNQWAVSLDIRQDPILRYSPWVEGLDREVVVYE